MDPPGTTQTFVGVPSGQNIPAQLVNDSAMTAAGGQLGDSPVPCNRATLDSQVLQEQNPFVTSNMQDVISMDSLASLSTYSEVVSKLNTLWDDQLQAVQCVTDEHWKSQEFPLARIKKVMRMDEDVRMISAEVPVMFSKAIEFFITELTLRAWLLTEEGKRRTIQRSDIAVAITKHDMFDFLIDIVPREELQLKAKTKSGEGEREHLQLLPPDVLQLCVQQLAQQVLGEEAEGAENNEQVAQASILLQQQLNLLQQLIQLQQLQQSQEQQIEHAQGTGTLGQTVQLQHPPQGQVLEHAAVQGQVTAGSILETQILQQSSAEQVLQQTQATVANIDLGQGQVVQAQSLSAFDSSVTGGQQTLHHVDPPHPADYQQQMLEASHPRSATVVIQQQSALMEAQNSYQLQHLDPHSTAHDQHPHHSMQELESIAQQVLVHPTIHQSQAAEHFTTQKSMSTQYVVSASSEDDGVQLQNIPENESISRSISPITANLPPTTEDYANTSSHHSAAGSSMVMRSPLSHQMQSQLMSSSEPSAQCETESINQSVSLGAHTHILEDNIP